MNQTESAFLKNVVLAAQQSQRDTGVPASVTIAQAILESGWGKSALARLANNFFGIKASVGEAPEEYIQFRTWEFIDGRKDRVLAKFVRYPSPVDSFKAHARLLATMPRYASAMRVVSDPFAFAVEIQACGYSTDPKYAEQLAQLIREFDLTQYDLRVQAEEK